MNDTLDKLIKRGNHSKQHPSIKENPIIKDGGKSPFRSQLSIPLQNFTISPFEDIILHGVRGVKIYIEANSFVYMNGIPVREPVEIELKEVYLKSAMVREDLTTTTRNGLLESGGMIYLNATSYDQNVAIRRGTAISIEMPRSQNDLLPGMSVFNGQRSGDQPINWSLNKETRLRRNANLNSILRNRVLRRFRNLGNNALARGLNKYLYEVTQLGWTNCDRYIFGDRPLTSMTVIENTHANIELKVVLKEYNTTFSAIRDENIFRIPSVPLGEKIYLVGLGKLGEDTYLGIKEVLVEEEMVESLEFKMTTAEQIRKKLKVING